MGCSVTRSFIIPLSIRTRYSLSFIFGISYERALRGYGFFIYVFFDGFDLVDHRQGVHLQSMGVPQLSCQRVSQQQRRNNNTDFPHLHQPFARVLIGGLGVRVCLSLCVYTVCIIMRTYYYYAYCTTTVRAKAGCQRNNNNIIVFARTIERRSTPKSDESRTLLLAAPLPHTHPIYMYIALFFILFSSNVIIKTRGRVVVAFTSPLGTCKYAGYDCCGIKKYIFCPQLRLLV